MFNKNCAKCNKKIKKSHNFCEFCGFPQKKKKQEDWGMLGESDLGENQTKDLFGGFGGGILNKMIGSAMKMIEKEIQKERANENKKTPPKMNSNIRLMINGEEIPLREKEPKQDKIENRINNNFSRKNLEKFSKLEKKEPKTSMKRFSDKIVYELQIPKVKSIEDISIVNLENSIEIKAVSKDKAYFKLIPIGLPVKNYHLEKGKLVLEIQGN